MPTFRAYSKVPGMMALQPRCNNMHPLQHCIPLQRCTGLQQLRPTCLGCLGLHPWQPLAAQSQARGKLGHALLHALHAHRGSASQRLALPAEALFAQRICAMHSTAVR